MIANLKEDSIKEYQNAMKKRMPHIARNQLKQQQIKLFTANKAIIKNNQKEEKDKYLFRLNCSLKTNPY